MGRKMEGKKNQQDGGSLLIHIGATNFSTLHSTVANIIFRTGVTNIHL